MKIRKIFFCFILLIITGSVYSQNYLENTEFSTKIATQETILNIPETGMYSIQVNSPTGTKIEIIDRMSGILESSGYAGYEDGRIDIMLGEGEYKIKLYIDVNATGNVVLNVLPYKELNTSFSDSDESLNSLQVISDGEVIYSELGDLEQRSYWAYIEDNEPLRLEIMGRCLSGVVLWKDGAWLTPVSASVSTYEPESGKPMTYIEYYHELNEGYYLLTCYGGERNEWTGEQDSMNTGITGADENPFYLRYGIPYIGETGAEEITVSPFGRDVFRFSEDTYYFEVARENYEETYVSLNRFSRTSSRFSNSRRTAEITNQSENSYCVITYNSGGYDQLLVIEAEPGSNCRLKFYNEAGFYQFINTETENYWISSIDSIEGQNLIDMSPVLYDTMTNQVLKHNAPLIGPLNPYVRKVNLLSESTVYVYIEEPGTYRIIENEEYGAIGSYWFVLFEQAVNNTYSEENFLNAGEPLELTEGLYIMSIKPEHQGILHFVLYNESTGFENVSQSDKEDALNNALKLLQGEPQKPVNYFTWPLVQIPGRTAYEKSILLFLNPRKVSDSRGLIVKELPLLLDNPLPVFIESGGTAEVSIKIEKASTIKIGGNDPEVNLTGAENRDTLSRNNYLLNPGEYIVRLSNNSEEVEMFTVSKEIEEFDTPPPPQIKPVEEVFTFLTEDNSLYLDFDYNEQKEFILRVTEPGFYRVETSGRLAMSIDIRTYLAASLFSESKNGTARNALVQTYLKPGDYLVIVKTLGESSGRAGIHLNRTPMTDAGELYLDSYSRNTADENYALKFRVEIEDWDEYGISSYGYEYRDFYLRFEDQNGWPIVSPLADDEISAELKQGTYFLYSLPEPLKTRRITRLYKIHEEPEAPDVLVLNRTKYAEWRESPERTPDTYFLNLTASIDANIIITEGMEATILKDNQELYKIPGGYGVATVKLTKGDYRIDVISLEENNYFPYSLEVFIDCLIPGIQQEIDYGTIKVIVDEECIVDIWSTGGYDKKASLWDETGTVLLAENDDMDNDWNFRISRKLIPGIYQLEVEDSGAYSYTSSNIHMEIRKERIAGDGKLPFEFNEVLNKDVLTVPFVSGSSEELVQVETGPNISIALYKEQKLLVKTQGSLYIPLDENSSYTLQFWHNENTGVPVLLTAEIRNGLEIAELGNEYMEIDMYPYIKFINNTGLSYYITSENSELLYSSGTDRPCTLVGDFPVNTEEAYGWLVCSGEDQLLEINPLVLTAGSITPIILGDIKHSFYINNSHDGVYLLEAETQGILTGCMVLPEDHYSKNNILWETMHIEPSETLSGIFGKELFQGVVWKINSETDDGDLQRVNMILNEYPVQEQIDLNNSVTFELESGKACEVDLGNRIQELNILLAHGLAAYSVNNSITEKYVNADAGNIEETITVSGGKMIFINRGDTKALFRITRTGYPSETVNTINQSNQYEKIMETRGRIEFNINASSDYQYSINQEGLIEPDMDGYVLCVSGNITDAVLYTETGNIYYGRKIFYSKGYKELRPYFILPSVDGKLLVDYRSGYLKVWLSSIRDADNEFLESNYSIHNAYLENSIGQLAGNTQNWSITLNEPGFINIETGEPGITALMKDNEIISISAGTEGRSILSYAESGTYKVITRPFEGSLQSGSIVINKIPILEIEEKTYFIGPYETQVFRFEVTDTSVVGIGIETEMDLLECSLYSRDFVLLESGSIIFDSLDTGEYFIIIQSDDMPVQYKPIVLGVSGSNRDVPQDVIENYK